jgi:two-component system, chemotaxis family, protein-glutamate methylesterase/glutaminase
MTSVRGVIVIGVSSGGFDALPVVLKTLPATLDLPVIVVSHRKEAFGNDFLVEHLSNCCPLEVVEALQLDILKPGRVYIAPGGYHIEVNQNGAFSLNVDDFVCNVRPSVDLLFKSAAQVFGSQTVGVILTGANRDGAEGLAAIERVGGIAIVQNPETAHSNTMPIAAITLAPSSTVLDLELISDAIMNASCHIRGVKT